MFAKPWSSSEVVVLPAILSGGGHMNVFVKAQKQVGTKCLPQTHSSLSSAALPSCRPFSAGFTQSAQQSKQLRHQYNQELLGHPQVRYIALHTINCIVFCVLPWVGFVFLGFALLEVYVLAATTTTAALQHLLFCHCSSLFLQPATMAHWASRC